GALPDRRSRRRSRRRRWRPRLHRRDRSGRRFDAPAQGADSLRPGAYRGGDRPARQDPRVRSGQPPPGRHRRPPLPARGAQRSGRGDPRQARREPGARQEDQGRAGSPPRARPGPARRQAVGPRRGSGGAAARRQGGGRDRVDGLVAAKRWDDALAVIDKNGDKNSDKNSASSNGALASALATRRAEILLRAGREAEGRKSLNDLAASSDNSTILAAAQSFQRVDRYPDSIPILQRLVSRQPESAIGHYLLGAAFERTGKRAEAVAELRRVLQIDPDFHAALNYLGYTLAESKENLDEALSLVQRAVALEPDNGAYVDSLGWTYYQLGRNEQARGYLERAARLEPADATLQEHLGDVYVALGQNDRA